MRLTPQQKLALHPFNIVIVLLSFYVIIALLVDAFVPLPVEIHKLLRDIDYIICAFFFIDFLYHFFTAKSKLRYMRWGWIDLISSIPVMDVFLAGRMFRIVQLLRVLRAFRSLSIIFKFFFKDKIKGAFTSAAIIGILMLIFCSIGILVVERDAANGNIKTASDALWWAFVTITTVGYGDHYPVTTPGRVIAAALMTVGVGLFGTFTAYVASWFVQKREEQEEEEQQQAREKAATDKAKSLKKEEKHPVPLE